jgi:hypothetical protein
MLLPACGFALAIFGGWVVPARLFAEELQLSPLGIAIIRVLLRFVAPSAIAAVTLASFLSV